MGLHDADMQFGVVPGNYTVRVGSSSVTDTTTAWFTVSADQATVVNAQEPRVAPRSADGATARLVNKINELKRLLAERS